MFKTSLQVFRFSVTGLEPSQILQQHLWVVPVAIGVIYLAARAIVRRLGSREEAIRRRRGEADDAPTVGPEGFARARRQFLLTLALLLVIVVVSILTSLQ